MEIEKAKLRDMLLWLFEQAESIERELLAHRGLLGMLKASGVLSQMEHGELDRALETARKDSAVVLADKYAKIRAVIPQLLDQADADQALSQFLQGWKPEGQAN